MPSEYGSAVAAQPKAFARSSAIVELHMVLWMITKSWPDSEIPHQNFWLATMPSERPDLMERIRTFWEGEQSSPEWLEILVLAQRSDTLFDQDLDGFVERLEFATGPSFEAPVLATESESTNRQTTERLAALSSSEDLRSKYASLLSDTFAALRPDWDREGQSQAEERALSLSRQMIVTPDPLKALPSGSIARNEVFAELIERLISERDTVVVPSYFGGRGSGVVALPGLLLIAQGLEWDRIEKQRRTDAKVAAKRFKILSDPTRLAILAQLTKQATSIRDLAARFELSQPTVSTHVKMLREADLLDSRQAGNLTLYTANGPEIRQWIADGVNTVISGAPQSEDCPIVTGNELPVS